MVFFPLLSKFWLFYLLQAQFHYGWCGSRDSFGISCPRRWALVHVRRSVFVLGHQAGLANLLLLLDGYLHHGFTVLFSLWVCLQRSFWIFWSREKNYILGTYCVGVGGNRCRVLGWSFSIVAGGVEGKGWYMYNYWISGYGCLHTLHLVITYIHHRVSLFQIKVNK